MPAWLGPAISAASSLASSLFGGDDGPSFQAQLNDNVTAQNRMIEQGVHSNIKAISSAAKQYGIHELALLGQQGFSPSFNFSGAQGSKNNIDFEGIGQGVGRAVDAVSSRSERAVKEVSDRLSLENMSLQNDLLRSQISSINRSGVPARPAGDTIIPGQGNSELSVFEGGVSQRHPDDPSRADLPPLTMWRTMITPDGREVMVPSPEAGSWMENDMLGTPRWYTDMMTGHWLNNTKKVIKSLSRRGDGGRFLGSY